MGRYLTENERAERNAKKQAKRKAMQIEQAMDIQLGNGKLRGKGYTKPLRPKT